LSDDAGMESVVSVAVTENAASDEVTVNDDEVMVNDDEVTVNDDEVTVNDANAEVNASDEVKAIVVNVSEVIEMSCANAMNFEIATIGRSS
jgi:hypothetical protein